MVTWTFLNAAGTPVAVSRETVVDVVAVMAMLAVAAEDEQSTQKLASNEQRNKLDSQHRSTTDSRLPWASLLVGTVPSQVTTA